MKHIDILLDFFATEHDKWVKTYFSLLPLELLQKIFDLKRHQELVNCKRKLHFHILCRCRSFGKSIYNKPVLQYPCYPYFSSNKIKIEHGVKIDGGCLSVCVRFSKLRKEYSELFSDKQYENQRPHFTIFSKTNLTATGEYHYQVLDWKYSKLQANLGKCL